MPGPEGRLSARAAQETGSEIRVIFELANELEDVVRLEIGDPDFDTPGHVIDAAAEAAHGGATHYTSTYGLPELRAAIAAKARRDNDVPVEADGVVVTNGGIEALALALLSVVEPGDEVVIPTPEWTNYAAQVSLAGGTPVRAPLDPENGFGLDPDTLTERFTTDTAAVLLCRPNNPTGRVYDEAAVRAVVEAAADQGVFVVADEVYERLTYTGSRRSAAALGEPDHVLSVNSFSKGYAMTGWRLGWLAGPTDVIDAAQVVRQALTTCSSSVAQHAGLAALRGPQEPYEAMVDTYARRRAFAVERVAEIPGLTCTEPEGAFYLFCALEGLDEPSMTVAKELLTEYGVSVTPGSSFGDAGEGYLRLSYALDEERLDIGLQRLEAYMRDAVRA
ncbi:MAG: pyridoxal phosphate-dependent aminotransferase [Halobacteriales archaeon]